jgi:hypothetical protein
MSDPVEKLEEWYKARCNGTWEHSWGIKIDTLDNPGWTVTIDLADTEWQSAHWSEWRVEKGEDDWVRCWKDKAQFRGVGDPTKLRAIVEFFVTRCSARNPNGNQ